jgi:hypothetical protein
MVSRTVLESAALGFTLAFLQSAVSVAALWWTRKKSFFMWVWAAGIVARFVFLLATAWFVHWHTDFSFLATLMTMVVSTTVLLVGETAVCFKG